MLVKYLGILPEILLGLNVIVLQFVYWFRAQQTPKTFATVSRVFFALAFVNCIIFYNLSFDKWYVNSFGTTFFKALVLGGALLLNGLSCRWFLSRNYASRGYYQLVSILLLGMCGCISARESIVFAVSLLIMFWTEQKLAGLGENTSGKTSEKFLNGLFFIILLGGGVIGEKYALLPQPLNACLTFGAVLYLLGSAPFHLDNLRKIRYGILPSSAFLAIICPFAVLAGLINWLQVNSASVQSISLMLKISGMLSVIFGAVGVGSRQNLKSLFACVSLFNIGVMVILLSFAAVGEMQNAVIYFLLCQTAMFGIYCCLYGIRSHGEYLQTLPEVSGMAEAKPYIAAGVLIFCASLLGIPPLLGMLAGLTMIETLLAERQYYLLAFMLIGQVILAYGLLRLIKSLYFDKRKHSFDRVGKEVYLSVSANIVLLIWLAVKFDWLSAQIAGITRSLTGMI